MKFWCVLLYLLGNVASINIQEDHLFLDKSKPLLIQCFTNNSSANIEFRLGLDSIATCKFSGNYTCVANDSRFLMFVNNLHIQNYFQLESVNTFDKTLCGTYTCIDLDTGIKDSVSVSLKDLNGGDDKDPSRNLTIGIVVPVIFVCAVCILGLVCWGKKRIKTLQEYCRKSGRRGHTPSFGSRRSSFEMHTVHTDDAEAVESNLEHQQQRLLSPDDDYEITLESTHLTRRDDSEAVESNWDHPQLRRLRPNDDFEITPESTQSTRRGPNDDFETTPESTQSTRRVFCISNRVEVVIPMMITISETEHGTSQPVEGRQIYDLRASALYLRPPPSRPRTRTPAQAPETPTRETPWPDESAARPTI